MTTPNLDYIINNQVKHLYHGMVVHISLTSIFTINPRKVNTLCLRAVAQLTRESRMERRAEPGSQRLTFDENEIWLIDYSLSSTLKV